MVRILIAALAAGALSVVLLHNATHGRGAVTAARPSSQVAVIPGFEAPRYSGSFGVPTLPVNDPQLSAYHFTQVPAANATTATLQHYDTVLLYGMRWSDLSATAQQAINAFARTGKVLIWDSDGTGAQNYASFFRPFATDASGENGRSNGSVVSFPGGVNFLASSDPNSPAYLDPNQLVTDRNMVNDMNAMKLGTSNWVPALVAANKSIPQGGWPIAWTYGVIGNHTGLTIYSGIDADAFTDELNPNYSIKEVALELAAKSWQTPDPSCAPGCKLPTSSGGKPFAACSFQKRVPTHWVHGRLPIVLKTSAASGISGKILTKSGRVVAAGRERSAGLLRLLVNTKRLPSNHSSRLRAAVYVNGQQACVRAFRLKVDNTPPRLLMLSTTRTGGGDLLRLRVSEVSSVTVTAPRVKRRRHPLLVPAHKTVSLRFAGSVRAARLVVRDRAGNGLARRLHW